MRGDGTAVCSAAGTRVDPQGGARPIESATLTGRCSGPESTFTECWCKGKTLARSSGGRRIDGARFSETNLERVVPCYAATLPHGGARTSAMRGVDYWLHHVAPGDNEPRQLRIEYEEWDRYRRRRSRRRAMEAGGTACTLPRWAWG